MQRWDSKEDTQRCLCCGSHVTPDFRRSHGDEQNRAHRCPQCDTFGRVSSGSAAGKDINLPDPLDDPTRFPSTFQDLPDNVKAACRDRSEAQSVATDGGESR